MRKYIHSHNEQSKRQTFIPILFVLVFVLPLVAVSCDWSKGRRALQVISDMSMRIRL